MPTASEDLKIKVLQQALAAVEREPKKLSRYLEFFGDELAVPDCIDIAEVIDRAARPDLNDPVKLALHHALARWDYSTDAGWTTDTEPNTPERRKLIYRLLGLDTAQGKVLDRALPSYAAEQPVVIAAEHERWYTAEIEANGFYWKAYRQYLASVGGWKEEALLGLDASTRSVIERLSNPSREDAFQSKGLVVGYVQSGKTANFTGVVARAADAGYRLIVVLAGATELLRKQTQRRLDKEMIGREFLDKDYEGDRELDSFISHGTRPSQLGYFDWQRLTGPEYDYQSLKRGIDALEFEKASPRKPFHSPENLRSAKARLIVIKKNSVVMGKVLEDLDRVKARVRLEDIPALVIDDESDQASLNTRPADKERPAVNGSIVQLLRILPRAQYVGYTATPFANVFVDPAQPEDLFPKDFLLSLPRPPGYMGVSDFYDLDRQPPYDPKDLTSKRSCFVRPVKGDDLKIPENLTKAVDSFILTGAIKLYRVAQGIPVRGIHHTMLVHLSSRKGEHEQHVTMINQLLNRSDYRSGAALDRLEALYRSDFRPVTAARAPDLQLPSKFSAIVPHIGETLERLAEGGKRVLMVNSDEDADTPVFDEARVWKIIVGGTKLSRGYTVEGLTVSYYRRSARTADTLMQMGRWFGFRQGYADLVRLFIGTEEPLGKGKTIDLYEAFGGVCRDEEMFRGQLKQYASMDDPRILPIQIPPLVPAHLLKPTSSNKMFNAKVRHQNFRTEWVERTMLPTSATDTRTNWNSFLKMVEGTRFAPTAIDLDVGDEHLSYDIMHVDLAPERVMAFLKSYRWLGSNPNLIARELDFMSGTGDRNPEIDRWLVIAPQRRDSRSEFECDVNGQRMSAFDRGRVDGDRVGVISEPRHKVLAEYASLGKRKDADKPRIANPSAETQKLYKARQAVMLLYPIPAEVKKEFQPGFALFFPPNKIRTPLVFGVADQRHRDAATTTA
ncbi:Z1 domain-containing protein [Bradyrhizobium liaoningense]|uniref:Z1 domain-containing protein n=1 Tax=Bradyrhizobium liaoningense TaxID=43992 RepID=UPI001BA7B40D|nr:Z1 domain-containing protein [Bradyrhizobium liaoningense]MBR0820290.1 Z1 domain-containing protein [Bradyrhizobium liaoningense]